MHGFEHEEYAVVWEKLVPWLGALGGKAKAKREVADRPMNFIYITSHQ